MARRAHDTFSLEDMGDFESGLVNKTGDNRFNAGVSKSITPLRECQDQNVCQGHSRCFYRHAFVLLELWLEKSGHSLAENVGPVSSYHWFLDMASLIFTLQHALNHAATTVAVVIAVFVRLTHLSTKSDVLV